MKKIKSLFLIFLLALTLGFIGKPNNVSMDLLAQDEPKDEREMKAVWMSTFVGEAPYTSERQFKSDMNYALDMMEYYGLNSLVFHVRTHNNAFYKSELNPVASWWSGANFDVFDPIGWLIDESHKRGIEFHAWMNPYRVDTTYQSGLVPASNPQRNSSNLIVEGSKIILNPALQIVRDHINDTIEEFITMYPTVDAIHFDDYFYIETNTAPTSDEARRNNVSLLIEGLHHVISDFNEANNTAIQLGISPTGIYRNGNGNVSYDSNGHAITTGSNTSGFQHYGNYLYADTVKWAEEGWIDYLTPQTYWARNLSAARFEPLVNWWDKVFKNLNTNLYAGIGVYMANNANTAGWGTDMYEMDAQLDIIKGLEHVQGYSIYSFKHLKFGYTGESSKSGQQIRNAYGSETRRSVTVPPVIRTMTPVVPGNVTGITHLNGTLSWQETTDAKFYYIYRSSGELTYSSDEIIGVVGGDLLSFDTGDNVNLYNYGVRALSRTNHLSGYQEPEPIETYTIDYNLNGGDFISDYESRDEMIEDFLTDFYEFLNLDISLTDFMHGYGNVSGFSGIYDNEEYFNQLYNTNNKSVNPSTNKFINQPEYNKWVPLFDLMDEYTKAVNASQSFWGSLFEGRARIKNFIIKYNYNKPTIDPLLNKIPEELHRGVKVYYEYNEYTDDYILPTPNKPSATFLGWYDNPCFSGNSITILTKGSTGNKTYYAKWQEETPVENITIKFKLGYNNLELDDVVIPFGSRVEKPANPVRPGFVFLGWYSNGALHDFNSLVYEDLTLTANWQVETVNVTFELGHSGLVYLVETIDKGSTVTKPTNPTRVGYEFIGWYSNGSLYNFSASVNSDLVLSAKWEKIIVNYVVTFDINYVGGTNPETLILEEGSLVAMPIAPARQGYVFLGWFDGDNLYDSRVPLTRDINLIARWEEEILVQYVTVTFDVNYEGGNYLSPITTIKGSSIEEPLVTRSGYEFVGWFDGSELFNFNKPILSNVHLVARWEVIIVDGCISSIDGASIRLETTDDLQGLRFYGKLCTLHKNNEHGFYVIYGNTTKEHLENKIDASLNNDFYINGKKVFKVRIGGSYANNEFSVVLTGIPLEGYLDVITVAPYIVIDEEVILAEDLVSRSVGEVAIKSYEQHGTFKELVDVIEENMFIYKDLQITKGTLYSNNIDELKENFIKDWNAYFETNWVDISAGEFFTEASAGVGGTLRNNRDLSNTNLYKFFNDEKYKARWEWLLDYFLYLDEPHPTRQIIAIKGDGTNNINDGWSNRGVLYKANHLIYSIHNFFNKDHRNDGFPTINFTQSNLYDNVLDYNNSILVKELNSDNNYLMKNSKILLEEVNEIAPSGFKYKYFDGTHYYEPNSIYTVTKEATLSLELVALEGEEYVVRFYDENIELKDLLLTYQIGDVITLPTPVKPQYKFIGWYLNIDLSGESITHILSTDSGDKAFYAKWEETGYNTITYNLLGGEFVSNYCDKDEMTLDFLKDFYDYLDVGVSFNDFVGENKDGLWHEVYKDYLYKVGRPTRVDNNYFISSEQYMDKWLPFFDMLEEFVASINSTQSFWASKWTGLIRIKEYVTGFGWKEEHDETYALYINMMPKEYKLVTIFDESTEDIYLPIPQKEGDTFLGWYNNVNFIGSPVTVIPTGTTTNITLYAKWENTSLETYDVSFDLNYETENKITYQQIITGNKVIKPKDPIRAGYTFIGWYSNDVLYDFNNDVTTNLTLIANWQETSEFNITYNLNGGSLTEEDLLAYKESVYAVATHYDDFMDESGKPIAISDEVYGQYWRTIALGETSTKGVYTIIGKGIGFMHPGAALYIRYHGSLESEYESVIINVFETYEVGSIVIVKNLPESYTTNAFVELYFIEKSEYEKDLVVNSLDVTTLLEPTKEYYNFLGWYSDSDFTNKVESLLDLNEDTTLYARWGFL